MAAPQADGATARLHDAVVAASAAYAKPESFRPSYGTAGFRTLAGLLGSTVFRCGLLAAARALEAGATTGVMITASHNPAPDNGVKMVEPDGGTLPQDVEPLATELANCSSDEQLATLLLTRALPSRSGTSQARPAAAAAAAVLVGHDTRPSAPDLLAAALAGVAALGVRAHSYGAVTTPQLHWLVAAANASSKSDGTAPLPSLDSYFSTILGAFLELARGTAPLPGPLVVDCANGVGAQHLRPLVEPLQQLGVRLLLRNTGGTGGELNHRCGADYVQKERVPPEGFGELEPGARWGGRGAERGVMHLRA